MSTIAVYFTVFAFLFAQGAEEEGKWRYKIIGDMGIYVREIDPNSRSGASAQYVDETTALNLKWTNNRIPYIWNSAIKDTAKAAIIQAMQDIMTVVPNCWTFEEIDPSTNPEYYVRFEDTVADKCMADLGNMSLFDTSRTFQIANFGTGCVPGIIIHELMHSMGFMHEMNRADRDKFVIIHWENIAQSRSRVTTLTTTRVGELQYNGDQFSFWRDDETKTDADGTVLQYPYVWHYYGVPYNFDSLMHYNYWSPSNPSLTAIESLNNPEAWGNQTKEGMGQLNFISKGDILAIARHGGCPVDKDPAPFPITNANSDAADKKPGVSGTELKLNFVFKS